MTNTSLGDDNVEDPLDVMTDKEYLKDLAERLFKLPAACEVDQYDYDRVMLIATAMPEPECQHEWEHGWGSVGPIATCKKCGHWEHD